MWLLSLACSPVQDLPAGSPDLVNVTMDAGGVHLAAAGAWVDGDGSSGHAVVARAETRSDPQVIVEGDRSQFDLRAGTATFEGRVHIVRAGAVDVHCDRVDAHYADGKLVSAEATGSVVVTDRGRTATAKRAVIAADHIELYDDVRVTDGDDRLTGASVTLWFEEDRLDCAACRLELAPR
jgi:lipopolysaccharide transport protein LptA